MTLRKIALSAFVIGALGLFGICAVAIAHYGFGMPIYGPNGRYENPTEVARTLAPFAKGFGICTAMGAIGILIIKRG